MNYILGLDDTDNLESRGTGHLARELAKALAQDFAVHGVTRHQLLEDPRVPKTAKNSCAAILFSGDTFPLDELAAFARHFMLNDFQPGSDPGLCVTTATVPDEIIAYGQRAQREFLTQKEPRKLANQHKIWLQGLGGDEDGVIGALAAVGLAASGSDGRYVQVGTIRDLVGLLPPVDILAAGIAAVKTLDGVDVTEGLVNTEKMRPARRNGQPILFVEKDGDLWQPLKLD